MEKTRSAVGKTIEALALTASKFEELKGKGKDYKPTKYELGSLFLDYSKSIEEMKHECESCIHLLKDKYQSERRKVMQHQTSSLEELYQECGSIFKPLPGLSVIQRQMKDKSHFLRYCKLSDQFFDARNKINEEIKMTDSLIAQGARSSRIKPSLPRVREIKDVMDKALNEQRSLIKQKLCNPNFFSSKEAILAEVETELQKATIEWISYVDPEMNSRSEITAADTETVLEEGSATLNLSANDETDHD